MKYKALAAAIACVAFNAQAFEGRVVDGKGKPIAGAKVEVLGKKKHVITDEKGRFEVADDVDELHISASGYGHKVIHLHELNGDELLDVMLANTVIEQVDVVGFPIHASVIESALPVSVLSGEDLRQQQAATLGDTLERQPGVTTNFHGNVASTPIIRGLSGPRVLITQNSLDVSDVSRVGPDHSVASEVATAEQIEVLRGPATLFYGSGAIGGVVNVVDQRVPIDSETRGEFFLSHESVNSQNLDAFNVTTGTEKVAFYADAFWRDSDDYDSPVAAEMEVHDDVQLDGETETHHNDKTVANSAEESKGFTLGSSYLMDRGYLGVSYGRLEREHGIPGHSHGGHSDANIPVLADLEHERIQILSEFNVGSKWIRSLNARAAYADYDHAELENGDVGTALNKSTTELRLDINHQELMHWKGGINFHYKSTELDGSGAEFFTPASDSETLALAIMEEKHIGKVLLQWGARAERVTINADNVLLPHTELHSHSEAPEDEQNHDEHADELTRVFAADHEFTPVTVSLGAVWDFAPGYNIGVALSHAARAPSAAELLSFGPHVGTRSFEAGALFNIEVKDGEAHFALSNEDFALEKSNNIDLTLRKHEGNVGIILNAFYNLVDDYYFQEATGYYAPSGHAHEGDEHNQDVSEDEHEDELPVYLFRHADAELYGFEAQVIWQINKLWKSTFFSDFVNAELTDGDYLPRTTPMRIGADIDFSTKRIDASLHWMHYADQEKVASFETKTDGYNMLDANLSYKIPNGNHQLTVFLKAENITDTEARVHTSFIKDVAPRPGRNFSLGIRGTF